MKERSSHFWMQQCVSVTIAMFALAPLLWFPGGTSAQTHDGAVTFTRDVAPILQQNCEVCHRSGSIAPMPLRSYDEVRPFAPLIRQKVVSRVMPPWPIDMTVGIQKFKNDRSLTEEEIETIALWVDSGAQMGDPADMPAGLEWPDWSTAWRFEGELGRPPDVVVSTPSYRVLANSGDDWPWLESEIPGLTERRWIKAAEFRPATAETWNVFHHSNPGIIKLDGTQGGSLRQVRGNEGTIYAEDSGQPVDPGDIVRWNMHLYANDGTWMLSCSSAYGSTRRTSPRRIEPRVRTDSAVASTRDMASRPARTRDVLARI